MTVSMDKPVGTATHPEHWQDALVLLLAHGSESTPQGATFVHHQADALRQRGIFADVQAAFLRDIPHPRDAIVTSAYREIYVVPFMVAEGYSIDVMIPEALALNGPLTKISTTAGRKRVHLCRAIGTHRAVRDCSQSLISSITSDHGLNPNDTAALVLCHGTPRHQGGRNYAEQVVRDLENRGLVAQSTMLFLADTPGIDQWRASVSSRYVIALPYLMTAGRHGAIDIPGLLGIDPAAADFQASVMGGEIAGPFDVAGRKLWYAPLLGTLDTIPDIVIDRIADWDKPMIG